MIGMSDIGSHESMDALRPRANRWLPYMAHRRPHHACTIPRASEVLLKRCESMDDLYRRISTQVQHAHQRSHSGKPDLFICGHSHILKVVNDPKIDCLHMNPGAFGHHGFHKVRTMLRFDIVQNHPNTCGKVRTRGDRIRKRGQLR